MLQHLLLLVVAPPLLVGGRPGLVLALGLPRPVRTEVARIQRSRWLRPWLRLLRNPLALVLGNAVALWAWHLPSAYELALSNPIWHAAEHLTFLGASLILWGLVIATPRQLRRRGPAMLALFLIMLASAALGAVITFSRTLLYPSYQATSGLWGVSPLGDQQLAGALMWIPPGGLYLATIVVLAWRWLTEMEREMRRREAPAPAGRTA
jgi:cytochrome c oxidase assembly factor CtaG